MDNVSNIKARWLIREYAVIDTMDERMTLEITCLLAPRERGPLRLRLARTQKSARWAVHFRLCHLPLG